MYITQKYGEVNSISNLIQIKDWGESIDAGYTFSFIIQRKLWGGGVDG